MTVSMTDTELDAVAELLKDLGVDFDETLRSHGAVHVATHSGHVIKVSERDLTKTLKQVEAKLGSPAKLVIKGVISKFC